MNRSSSSASVDILPELRDRWSPYVFEPRPIEPRQLVALFEAARWAASSYNEQPWRFVIALRDQDAAFEKALGCLMETNQVWARHASLIGFTVVARHLQRNGNPNRVAQHDLGLAMANLCTQATALGLAVHQMGGVNLSKIRTVYGIPETYEPVTGFAVGYHGDPQSADPALAEREQKPRTRRPLAQTVFGESWGEPAGWIPPSDAG